MLSGLIASIAPSIIQAVVGKKLESDGGAAMQITKGLIGSKTARDATFALAAKVAGVLVFPLPGDYEWLRWVLLVAVFVEWGAQLYRRVKTSEPV